MRVLAAICVFCLLLLLPLHWVAFDLPFYQETFEENGVYTHFGDKELVDSEFAVVLEYAQGKDVVLSDFYNTKEKEHMKDVRWLFWLAQICMGLSYVFLVGMFLVDKHVVRSGFLLGSTFACLFVFGLGLFAFVNFDFLFTLFHKILFRNDLWLLNPATDNLIRMLPEVVFFRLAARTGGLVLLGGIISGLLARRFK